MNKEKGNLTINSENIFPIIKKWLYTDKDIFIRELISNANDAIIKLKKLSDIGETKVSDDEEYKIVVKLDEENKTISITDNGIGMDKEEIEKYINEIAFSGAKDFAEKYADKTGKDEIIGHFGLGFYSSFMVSEKVEIDTLSYKENKEAVKWISDGNTEYEIYESNKKERGTTITLHILDEEAEFLNEYNLRQVISKYCSFMPINIYFEKLQKDDNKKDENDEKSILLNETKPLWMKDPKDCTDEEYKAFYQKTFMDYNEPLFWIHLNMDYPANLKGILYFPKFKHEYEMIEGQVKLYSNQVYVADNIKEVIPEFMLLLKGAIDMPDLPLNVSRSMLQTDDYVKKISNYIIKKIGDKLKSLFKKEFDRYKDFWSNIHTFVKFGCLKEEKFYDKVKDIIIYKDIYDKYITIEEYLKDNTNDKKNIYYVSDETQQSQYIKMFKENELNAIILTSNIDTHFMGFLESKLTNCTFTRVDSNIEESLTTSSDDIKEETIKSLQDLFKNNIDSTDLKIEIKNLKDTSTSAMILLSEQTRRMKDMAKMFAGSLPPEMMNKEEKTLILNNNNTLIKFIKDNIDNTDKEDDIKLVCKHIYDLASISHAPLESTKMYEFITRSQEILEKVINNK